jgi:hypothetical protein
LANSDVGSYLFRRELIDDLWMEFHIGRKIFNREAYDYLLNLRMKDNPRCKEAEFFPQYRS